MPPACISLRVCLLSEFQPFQLYAAAFDLGKIVPGLLHKPALLVAAENLGQPHAISGDMPRFPFTSSESVLRVTPRAAASVMVKPKRFNALLQHDKACLGRILHDHEVVPFSGNRYNQRPPRRPQSGKPPAS